MQYQSDNMEREKLFSQWYDTYGTMVLRTCYLYLGSKAEAEDATQDTFVKAWKHIGGFRAQNEKATKAWLMRIAVNTCRDRLRSAAWIHTNRHIQADDVLQYRSAPKEDIDLLIDVMSLPEKLRWAVLLYYYQHMTMEEVASVLNVTPSTIAKRLNRAEAKMKEMLE